MHRRRFRPVSRAIGVGGVAMLSFFTACAASRPSPAPAAHDGADAGATDATSRSDAATTSTTPLLTFEELAAFAKPDVQLLDEVLRSDDRAKQPVTLALGPLDHDACLRAAFSSDHESTAGFSDETNTRRGPEATGLRGLVPPQGPVCFKKGEPPRLVLHGHDGAGARVVVWASPRSPRPSR